MRNHSAILILIVGLGLGTVMAIPAAPATDQAKIAQLVTQLGSDNFRKRDAAKKELDAIGEPALEALGKAAKSTDMEIANNASALIAKIEARAENSRLIAPTYVELSFKETPVAEAVAELARKSGYPIFLGGDKSKLADRRVTLETGKVAFWKALDMLCEKASLVEGNANPAADLPALPTSGIQPVQIQPAQPNPVQLRRPPVSPVNDGAIVLFDGKTPIGPVHVEGAIRIRAIKSASHQAIGSAPEGEIGVLVDVKAEPKIQIQQILGVKIDKAVDNHDQALTPAMLSSNSNSPIDERDQLRQIRRIQLLGQASSNTVVANDRGQMQIAARLKKGGKEATSIKELRGTVSLKMRTSVEEIVAVENILKAKGEIVMGKSGAKLIVNDVKKEENGDIKVDVELQCPHEIQAQQKNQPVLGPQPRQGGGIGILVVPGTPLGVPPPPPIKAQVPVAALAIFNPFGLDLVDAKGVPLALIQIHNSKNTYRPTLRIVTTTMTFRSTKEQEASKLVFLGTRMATVEVLFLLKDVVVK